MALVWRLRGFERLVTLAGIVPLDDVPIARRLVARDEAQHGLERGMPVKSAVVAEDELIEISVDVLAAQAMIRPEGPSLEQRESAMTPRQDDVRRHLSDDARIVPVMAGQSGIGRVAIGDQRGSRLHVGPHEGLDRRGRIVGDHGEAETAGARAKVLCSFPSGPGCVGVPINHLNGAGDEDFPGVAWLEERIADAEWNLRLIDLDNPFEGIAVRIDH